MPDIETYLGWNTSGLSETYATIDFGAIVDMVTQRHQVSITLFDADGTTRGAQNCRLVALRATSTQEDFSPPGTQDSMRVALVGNKDHPTLSDFTVRRGDTFNRNNTRYQVAFVDDTFSGRVVAIAEARQ